MFTNNVGKVFRGESIGEVFLKIRSSMLNKGIAKVVPTRLVPTLELLNPTIIITDPTQRLFYSEHRAYNLVYNIVEAYMLFNSSSQVKPFAEFNKKMMDYSDDKVTLNSAYGQYLAKHIHEIVEKLRYDSDTRQAALNIYTTEYGLSDTKDVPCTLNLHFLIRDGALNLTVYMRSNDLFWGFQYDVFMFTVMQEIVAKELGLPVGIYTHCPTSLHVYEYHWKMLRKINANNLVKTPGFNFDSDVSGAASASNLIVQLCESKQAGLKIAEVLKKVPVSKYLPIHLVILEYLYKHHRNLFKGLTADLKLQNGWFAPFTKRWLLNDSPITRASVRPDAPCTRLN